jgi:hypothetical protein
VRPRRHLTLLAALAACLAVGCGSDEEGKPLPRATAADLQGQLNSIEQRFEFPNGAACGDITGGDDPNTTRVNNLIDSLPADTDADLRDALQDSFDHLFQLVERECSDTSDQQTDTTETQTTPETDTTETQTTDTTETDTTETQTTPETEPTTTPEDTTGGDGTSDDAGGGFGPGEDGQ